MNLTQNDYEKLVKQASPNSKILKNCLGAFLVGGAICTLGQGLITWYYSLGMDKTAAGALTSITLIALAILLTAFHVFDKIAKFAGAGTLVPITGFANSMASPAMEFKAEGFILGLGAKMFSIAGPVIVYGTVASMIYGVILLLLGGM